MTDLNLAKEMLKNEGHSIVAVKKGAAIGTAVGPGVAPLLKLVAERGDDLNGAALADKVVGRAVALVCAEKGVKAVYGAVMSETAVEVLKHYAIAYEAGTMVATIMNRTQTDLCPIERISQTIMAPEGATAALARALATLRANAPRA